MKDLIFCQYCKNWVEYTHVCTYQVSLLRRLLMLLGIHADSYCVMCGAYYDGDVGHVCSGYATKLT